MSRIDFGTYQKHRFKKSGCSQNTNIGACRLMGCSLNYVKMHTSRVLRHRFIWFLVKW